MTIVLASASPRRQELLRNAGIAFEAQPANVREVPQGGELPIEYAKRLAREKAEAVARVRQGAVVLGADTIVVLEGQILEKPNDRRHAAAMLGMLSGRTHEVITGVCLMGEGFADTEAEITRVEMTQISREEIEWYVGTGEPMDKAGAYAIQGFASRWVKRIEGDYGNVVGLPVALVWRMMQRRKKS